MISFKVESDFFRAQLMSAALVGSPDLALRYEAEVEVERLREIRMKMRGQSTEKTPHVVSYKRRVKS